jgi:hypothetical protein
MITWTGNGKISGEPLPICQIMRKKFGQIIRKVTVFAVIWEIILRDSLVDIFRVALDKTRAA